MTQQIINVGTAPNDGLGDPIRTAFIKTDNNFTQLFSLPNANPPGNLIGNTTDVPGMYAYSSSYFYYCFASYDGTNNIWAKVPQVNSISVPNLVNGSSNIVVSANSLITMGVAGTANVATFANIGMSLPGNVYAGNVLTNNYFYANGAPFGGGGGTNYSNANVAAFLAINTGNITANNISASGNIYTNTNVYATGVVSAGGNVRGSNFNTAGIVNASGIQTGVMSSTGNITTAGIVTNNYYYANGQPFTGGTTYTNANVAAFLPTYGGVLGNGAANVNANQITAVGIVTTGGSDSNISGANVISANVVSATGNIQANYFIGNGSQLTGISGGAGNYSNANVAAYLPTYTGNVGAGNVSATGNIQANYILGNVAFATGIPATYGNSNVADYLPTYTGNLTAGNVSATGNVAAQGIISASGNVVTAGYFIGNFQGNVTGNFVVPGANTQVIFNTNGNADAVAGMTYDTGSNTLSVLGPITSTGNISGNYIFGNGSLLTGIVTSNVAGTVSANAQPNITSVGLLTSVTVAGNIVGNLVGNVTGNVTGSAATITANAQPNVTSVGTLVNLTVAGNVATANLSVTGTVAIPSFTTTGSGGDLTGANLIQTTSLSATGNVTVGNLFLTTSSSPPSTATYGSPGELAWDSNYIYVCTAPNIWKRSPLTGGY